MLSLDEGMSCSIILSFLVIRVCLVELSKFIKFRNGKKWSISLEDTNLCILS